MDPPSYILSPLFEACCLGVAKNMDEPYLVDGPDIPDFFRDLPRDVTFVTHNALFDMCIANWRFGYVPKLIVDTLALSRTLLSRYLRSLSLKSVAAYLGMPEKGGFLAAVKGMTRADIVVNGLWDEYTSYCLHDVELCCQIFLALSKQLPIEEFIVHDMVTRCAVEPLLRINLDVLAQHLHQVRSEKELIFAKAMLAGVDHKRQLMSNDMFAEILQGMGVDPPRKMSLATGQQTWAFSKNDIEFLELQDHDDPRVQAVVAARLGFKSTIEETRTERMLNIGQLEFPQFNSAGWMPVPLKIGAAITHRLGGDWKLNCQNWGRTSPIRRAVEAPEGYRVVCSDAAQIEARLVAWFCGQADMVEQFRQGKDVYALFATTVYGYPINKTDHPLQRFVGKVGILQLGYQSGWLKYQRTVYVLSGKEEGEPIDLTEEEARGVVDTYRITNHRIKGKWQELGSMIAWMANAREGQVYEMGPITFHRWRITGPNGLELYYENLQWDSMAGQWCYTHGGRQYFIYGGKLLENIIQFLARIAIMQAAVRIKYRLANVPVRFVHQGHDELVYLAREDVAEYVAQTVAEEMSREPAWAPGLPLKAEKKIGMSYG